MVAKLHVTLVQNSAGLDVARNLERIEELLENAPRTDLLVLPEVFALRGGTNDYREAAEPVPGRLTARMAAWARWMNTWVLGGSLMERENHDVFNTSVLCNREGEIVATYRKIHLFEAFLDDGQVIRETDIYRAGSEPVLVDIEGWQCGLSICYDVRFPELYRRYADYGAQILFVPSNFTQRTGKDHWEVLLRARAIENQCFVVAANQCGSNPVTGIASYGHSMVVGPWGEVVRAAGDEDAVLAADLDPALLEETRQRVPALQHRKLGRNGNVRG